MRKEYIFSENDVIDMQILFDDMEEYFYGLLNKNNITSNNAEASKVLELLNKAKRKFE